MCVDAHHAGDKQYVPNSFKLAFIPATAEAPSTSTVADNVVSRKVITHVRGRDRSTRRLQSFIGGVEGYG